MYLFDICMFTFVSRSMATEFIIPSALMTIRMCPSSLGKTFEEF